MKHRAFAEGSEGRRAIVASALGAALGLLVAVFSVKQKGNSPSTGVRRWRARSGN
ncbi:MAG: hypothetical protein WDA27_06605 [Actinomycetota bacterium]